MEGLSLISRALIMATPGGHSRLNSGSTVVLACGVSMPTRPRGAYSSDMSLLLRRSDAGVLDDLAQPDHVARDQRPKLLGRAGRDEGDLRQHLVPDILALQRLDEFD